MIRPVLVRNERDNVSLLYLYSATLWLVLGAAIGAVLSFVALSPAGWQGAAFYPVLTYGRLQPVYTHLIVYGWLSMSLVGLALYIVPALTGRRVKAVGVVRGAAWLHNAAVAAGALSLLMGVRTGREWAEVTSPLAWLLLLALIGAGYGLLTSVRNDDGRALDVPMWYFGGAFVWGIVLYAFGHGIGVPADRAIGLADALVNWFYGHNLLGLWLGMMGLGVVYYVLPRIVDRPIFSSRLAGIGFWGMAALYPAAGAYLIGAPIPEPVQKAALALGLLLLVPLWAVSVNLLRTVEGRWSALRAEGPAGRFLAASIVFYILFWFKGVFQLLPPVNETVKFTFWISAYEQLALMGAFTFAAVAGMYYVLPQALGRPLSGALASFHFWVSLVGVVLLYVALTFAGLAQGAGWAAGSPFDQVLFGIRPRLVTQAWAMVLLLGAHAVFAYNVFKTMGAARQDAPAPHGVARMRGQIG